MQKVSKEQAIEALERYKNHEIVPGNDFFIAVRDGTLPQYYCQRLYTYRFKRLDDLPQTDVRSLQEASGEDHPYKCQTTNVVAISHCLQGLIEQGVLDQPEFKQEVEDFVHSDLNFQAGDPNNQDRIDRINAILDKTLGYLQDTYAIDKVTL
jgi:hypothetical protein